MICPHVGQKPLFSHMAHTFKGHHPCPVIISFVSELQTQSWICAVKLTWWKKVSKSHEPALITGNSSFPFFVGSLWQQTTWGMQQKTHTPFLSGVLRGGKSAWFSLTSWGSWRLALLMAKLQRDVWRKELEGQSMEGNDCSGGHHLSLEVLRFL